MNTDDTGHHSTHDAPMPEKNHTVGHAAHPSHHSIVLVSVADHEGIPWELGLRFTRAYSTDRDFACARQALLTGQYHQRNPTTRLADVLPMEYSEMPGEGQFRVLERASFAPELLRGAEDSVVVITSPRGDDSLHVPMLISWPGVTTPGSTCSELVSIIDVAPTLAAIAGLDTRPNAALSFDGVNLIPVIRYGASAHDSLFFDDGTVIGKPADWELWHTMIRQQGPLQ